MKIANFLMSAGLLVLLVLTGCRSSEDPNLTIYSGRSKSLVEPVVQRFAEQTGIEVDVRYGDTAELAVALIEEGIRTRADVFWAQDAGALGAAAGAGLLAALPDSITDRVRPRYRSAQGLWVATSGRARTVAYSPSRVKADEIPATVFDLVNPRYSGRVGWAPSNASFQAFVTAMRRVHGDERTRAWLAAMQANRAVAYPKNTAIIQGIANGEIDLGLPNHYYLLRFKSEDAEYPVEQTHFAAGDIGNLVNVAGVGVIASTNSIDSALRFVDYVLKSESQSYFLTETFEYPVTDEVAAVSLPPDSLLPIVDLDELKDLDSTLDMLSEVGLL